MSKVRSTLSVRNPQASLRALAVEVLENRYLLSGGGVGGLDPLAPWRNPTLPLDVNHDGVVQPADVAVVINQLLKGGIRPLRPPDPANPPQYFCDTNGDNMISPADVVKVINRLLDPPKVTISTLMPFTIDLTPQVTVTATGGGQLPDGTTVDVDVDLNGDGNFDGPTELNQSAFGLFHGGSIFDLSPGIQPDDPATGPYTVHLRAHVKNTDGVEGYSPVKSLLVDTRTSNALSNYVNTPDPAYHYSLASTIHGTGYTTYVIDQTTQQWRTIADVDKPLWKNWVQIVVPDGPLADTALIYVHGGSNTADIPTSTSDTLVGYATQLHSVIVDLPDVPSEPLTFTGDPGNPRSEDEIIAYSYDQYMRHIGEPGNETWPVIQAMVKSVVRTMDTVQTYVPTVRTGAEIDHFVITGFSKRGWTTWLTPAVDTRVSAIIPGVFEMLNQGPELVHHYGTLGHFSEEIQDYTDLNIFGRILTPEGIALGQIVDPYHYLTDGHYNIPKLLLVSSGDQFFVSDSAQFYFHDLPGDENYIRYIPNTGHPLNDIAVAASTLTFYDALLNHRQLPQFSWTIDYDQTIRLHTDTTPTQVLLWQSTVPNRDFRQYYSPAAVWTSSVLTDQGGGVYLGNTPIPATGSTGYFIEMTYPSAIPGVPYVFTTEIRVNTTIPLVPWPYPGIEGAPALVTGMSVVAAAISEPEDLNAPASAIASASQAPTKATTSGDDEAASSALLAVAQLAAPTVASAITAVADETDPDTLADVVDIVLESESLETELIANA